MNSTNFVKKISIISISAAVVGTLLLSLMIFSIVKTNKDIATLTHQVQQEENKQKGFSSGESLIEEANPDIAKIQSSVIEKDGDVTFIENIEGLAREHKLGIVINSLALAGEKNMALHGLNILNVSFEVKGSWSDAYFFSTLLENLPYVYRINTFDIQNTGDLTNLDPNITASASGTWKVSVNMSVLKKI